MLNVSLLNFPPPSRAGAGRVLLISSCVQKGKNGRTNHEPDIFGVKGGGGGITYEARIMNPINTIEEGKDWIDRITRLF